MLIPKALFGSFSIPFPQTFKDPNRAQNPSHSFIA